MSASQMKKFPALFCFNTITVIEIIDVMVSHNQATCCDHVLGGLQDKL